MNHQFAIDENFKAYARALMRHHYLLEVGKGDDAEAERTEELLSALWGNLNDTQRLQLRGLSSDLNWLRRKYAPPPKGRKRKDVTPEELREFYRLNETQDLLRLLPALRVCASAVPPVFVARQIQVVFQSRLLVEVAEIGGLFSVILALTLFRAKWGNTDRPTTAR